MKVLRPVLPCGHQRVRLAALDIEGVNRRECSSCKRRWFVALEPAEHASARTGVAVFNLVFVERRR